MRICCPLFNQFLRLRPFVAFAMKLVKVDMKPLLFFFVGCFDDEVDEEVERRVDGDEGVRDAVEDLHPPRPLHVAEAAARGRHHLQIVEEIPLSRAEAVQERHVRQEHE